MRRFEYERDKSAKFWEAELSGLELHLRWGRMGTQGQSKVKTFHSPEQARAEHDRAIAEKVKEGYREVGGSGTAVMPAVANPEVIHLLDELKQLGATVHTGPPATEADLRAAERKLNFALPQEYREFLREIGGIKVELERTWFFYGLADAMEKTEEYLAEFDPVRDGSDQGPYYPRRFIVLMDEGEFSNAAAGLVFDADLNAMLQTDGRRYVSKDEAFQVGYWGTLLDELMEVRDRIADPDDILVAGSEREKEQKRKARASLPADEPRGERELAAAIERLYETFAHYPRQQIERRCFIGDSCEDCRKCQYALERIPLRELTATQLQHYAFYVLPAMKSDDLLGRQRQADYKHFLPRIHELIEEIGLMGNPEVVIGQLFKHLVQALDLNSEEQRAIADHSEALWASLLLSPLTEALALTSHLEAFVQSGQRLAPFLAIWSRHLSNPTALLHAAKLARTHDFAKGPSYYGWKAEPFAELRSWLLGSDLRTALSSVSASSVVSDALERIVSAAATRT